MPMHDEIDDDEGTNQVHEWRLVQARPGRPVCGRRCTAPSSMRKQQRSQCEAGGEPAMTMSGVHSHMTTGHRLSVHDGCIRQRTTT